MRGNETPSDAIGRHRMHSNARECNPLGAIRRNQTQSDAIRCNQMGEGNQLNCNQLKCNQLGAGAARAGTSCTRFKAIRGHSRQSEAIRAGTSCS